MSLTKVEVPADMIRYILELVGRVRRAKKSNRFEFEVEGLLGEVERLRPLYDAAMKS
jgi:hypothetical protein